MAGRRSSQWSCAKDAVLTTAMVAGVGGAALDFDDCQMGSFFRFIIKDLASQGWIASLPF